jgi:hypothetical protein
MRERRCGAALLALLAAAVACAEDGQPPEPADEPALAVGSPPPSAPLEPPGPEQPPPAPLAVPAAPSGDGWTAGTTRREHQVTGAPILAAFRLARNDGFDRAAFEFEGDLPSYHIEYVERPIHQCGSGNVVELGGDGWLAIRLEPAMAHTEEGRPTIEQRTGTPGLPVIVEHRLICDFEGQVEWVLGVSSPNPYRVMELSGPPRLVVDVEH